MGFVIASLVLLVGITVLGLAGLAVVTYVRRNGSTGRLADDAWRDRQLLDGIDRIEMRLTAMSERVERLERQLAEPPARREIPPGARDDQD